MMDASSKAASSGGEEDDGLGQLSPALDPKRNASEGDLLTRSIAAPPTARAQSRSFPAPSGLKRLVSRTSFGPGTPASGTSHESFRFPGSDDDEDLPTVSALHSGSSGHSTSIAESPSSNSGFADPASEPHFANATKGHTDSNLGIREKCLVIKGSLANRRGGRRNTDISTRHTTVLDQSDTKTLIDSWRQAAPKATSDLGESDLESPEASLHSGTSSEARGIIAESAGELNARLRSRPIMDTTRLAPASFEAPNRDRQIQDAKDMYQTVVRNAERAGSAVPAYDFIELIGKGGYGRVYKCKKRATGELVAVKIINIDDADFQEHFLDKDNTINAFQKEVSILLQLKDSNAKNINLIHEAFDLHNQLWIISDYCTGGSLRTLMRANPPTRRGFEEQYIIPIARELALAIKSVHDIGVIHRDLKCANVYVSEEGDIQLGDFGIVGVVDDGSSKRRTIVGTPHYLPLEMHTSTSFQTAEAYGTELDIWSYGITIFEAATGLPPYANVAQQDMHTVIINAPRLQGGDYSDGLRDFVAFCLNSDAKARPTIDEVLTHPFIAGTANIHPTRSLVRLIDRYAAWEYRGGQRQSLWAGGGAAAPIVPSEEETDDARDDVDDWNFSTSEGFNVAFGKRYSQMVARQDFAQPHFEAPAGSGLPPLITKELSRLEQFDEQHKELSANRGERSLDRLFNPEKTPYELHTPLENSEPLSDLPLRNMSSAAPTRESLIDLDSAGGGSDRPTINFDFDDIPTLKARTSRSVTLNPTDDDDDGYDYNKSDNDDKRATMEWTFPTQPKKPPPEESKRATMDWTFSTAQPNDEEDPEVNMNLPPTGAEGLPLGFRPTLDRTATEPVGQFRSHLHEGQQTMPNSSSPIRDSIRSMIDLDMGLADPADIPRPSTASSTTGSTMTDMTSGNPFDLEEDPEQNERDRNRFSYHKQWQSEGGQHSKRASHKTMAMHSRGSSLTSTDSEELIGYNTKPPSGDPGRTQWMIGAPPVDTSNWPIFPPNSGLDEEPQYPPAYGPRTNGSDDHGSGRSSRSNGRIQRRRAPQREMEFPDPVAPHSDVMQEDADSQLVEAEFDRLLDDLDDAIRATRHAFGGVHNEEVPASTSETDSAFDSSAAPTGDEDGF